MAITSVPQVLSQATDAYINAGNTSRLQTPAVQTGSVTVAVTNGAFTKFASITGNLTIAFSNVPSGYANQWYVEIAGRGSNTVAFTGVTWDGGSAPSIASGTGKTVILFYSTDGGTTIYGKSYFASIA
jgi:hypothetical protein